MLCSGHIDTQVKEECKLNQLRSRLETADLTVMDEDAAICCYAHSDALWVQDPAGIPWEAYRTMADAQFFSRNTDSSESACCAAQASENLISLETSENEGEYCN